MSNPRYANGTLRRKYRARLRAMDMPCGICNLSSLARDGVHVPAVKAQSPSHWTTREVLDTFSDLI